MFRFIKRWKEQRDVRKRREETLKDIKKAKEIYESGMAIGMCHSFSIVNYLKYNDKIRERIPEFRPETFNLDPMLHGFWWPIFDRDSRIKAFDKLIEIYSK